MAKKVRVRKFNFFKFFKFLLFMSILIIGFYYLSKIKIKNIVIKGNTYVSDINIMEKTGLIKYPSYFKTIDYTLENKIKKYYPLVKEVKVKHGLGFKITIEISEYKILYLKRNSNEYVLENGKKILDVEIDDNIPILINYVPDDIETKMISKFALIDKEVIDKISEIEYTSTSYDSERFLLYMNDGNQVYITLNKIKEFNNYFKIKKELGKHKGILYLDSGNYFEIKE